MYDNLYRGIKRSQPSVIRPNKKISSALFKDNGVSVDRKMERNEDEVIKRMQNFFKDRLKGVVIFSELDVVNAAACLIPAPSDENPYHAEIYKNLNREMLSNLQQLKLADSCKLIYYNEEIAWIPPGGTRKKVL